MDLACLGLGADPRILLGVGDPSTPDERARRANQPPKPPLPCPRARVVRAGHRTPPPPPPPLVRRSRGSPVFASPTDATPDRMAFGSRGGESMPLVSTTPVFGASMRAWRGRVGGDLRSVASYLGPPGLGSHGGKARGGSIRPAPLVVVGTV